MHGRRDRKGIVKRQTSLRVKDKEDVDDYIRPRTDRTGHKEELNRIVIPQKTAEMKACRKQNGQGKALCQLPAGLV